MRDPEPELSILNSQFSIPERCVWINGRLVAAEEATISVFDRGFLHGLSVFETMRAYGGIVLRLEDHLERLFRSASLVAIEIPFSREQLAAAVVEVLEANSLSDAAVRLTVSAGAGHPEGPGPSAACTARPLRSYAREQEEGVDVILASTIRVAPQAVPVEAKSGNYLNCLLARREAEASGAFEALMTDGAGHILEGSFTNVFAMLEERLITPPADGRILPGITRKVVLELAPSLDPQLEPEEASLSVGRMGDWEEAFLTSSLCEVVPIRRVNGRDLGPPGPVTRKVQRVYGGAVEQSVREGEFRGERPGAGESRHRLP